MTSSRSPVGAPARRPHFRSRDSYSPLSYLPDEPADDTPVLPPLLSPVPAEWADICEFLEAEHCIPVDPPGVGFRALVLERHQRAILRLAFTPEDGVYPYREVVWSCPKKSGKTEVAAGVTNWVGFTWYSYLELFACANDEDQAAGRVFRAAARAIEANDRLSARARIVRSPAGVITYRGTGNTLTALSSDYAGAAGPQRLAASFWDELWGYRLEKARRLYDELTPIPTVPNGFRFISTYAGFEKESVLLWEIFSRVVCAGGETPSPRNRVDASELDGIDGLPVYRDGQTLVYWDSYDTAGEACRRMPWQMGESGARYYEDQAKTLRPNSFKRFHWNLWTANEENLFTEDQWRACETEALRPVLGSARELGRVAVGADASQVGDSAAVVAVRYDPVDRTVKLLRHRVWRPSAEDPLDLEETMEAYILELCRDFVVGELRYDPWQFARSARTLDKAGVSVVEFPQTTPNLTAMGQNLWSLVRGRNLMLYPDDGIRQAASNTVAIETSRGWRLAKEKSAAKIDVIVALAMASLAAVEMHAVTPFNEDRLTVQTDAEREIYGDE